MLRRTTRVFAANTRVTEALSMLETRMSDQRAALSAVRELVLLDTTDDVSRAIADQGMESVVSAMRVHVNSVEIKEKCARCIANMSLALGTGAGSPSAADGVDAAALDPAEGVAAPQGTNRLVHLGAAELVVGLMGDCADLTPKGSVWVAAALLHLVSFSDQGAHRVAEHGGEQAVVDFLRHCLEVQRLQLSSPVVADSAATTAALLNEMAVDSAVATLMRITSLQTEGDSVLQFRFEKATLPLVRSVVATMLAFPHAAGIHHKGWEVLRMITSHHPNLFLVYEAIHSSDPRKGAQQLVDSFLAFMRLRELALEEHGENGRARGSGAAAPEELQALEPLVDAAAAAFVELTSPRHDLREGASVEEASYTLPVESALAIVDTLTAGPLSEFFLQALRRMLRQHLTSCGAAEPLGDAAAARAQLFLSFLANSAESDVTVRSQSAMELFASLLSSHRVLADAELQKLLACIWNIIGFPDAAASARDFQLETLLREVVSARKDGLGKLGEQLLEKASVVLGGVS